MLQVQSKIYDISDKTTPYKLTMKYGSVNRLESDVLYTRTKGKIKTPVKKTTYAPDIKEIKRSFCKIIKDTVNSNDKFDKKFFLCDVDISEKGLLVKKYGSIKYDIFVKPLKVCNMEEYEGDIKSLMAVINRKIFDLLKQKEFIIV